MDITSFYNVSSGAIRNVIDAGTETNKERLHTTQDKNKDVFASVLGSAMENITQANNYISQAENEEMKLAMGLTENTHDLTIALQKASTAIQYTVAIRDKFLESYRTIMNMQI